MASFLQILKDRVAMLSLLKESNLLQKLPVTLCAVTLFVVSSSAWSASFAIVDGQFVTSQQTLLTGETGTINSGGDLTTSSIAIISGASNITVLNNGAIKTTNLAIYSYSNSGTNTITNNGTITITGTTVYGIDSLYNSGTTNITNGGTITATNNNSNPIFSGGNSGTTNITNSGIITTNGQDGVGIYSFYQASAGTINITNSGTITTSGSSGSQGIQSNGNSGTANITNSGTITTSGQYSHGMYSYNNSGTENFTNSGTITTSGSNADGIYLQSNSGATTITNSGTINVTGTGAVGVTLDGGVTFTNSGTISATGSATQAIDSTGSGNDTLNLLAGSKITGSIDLGAGTDTVNISGTEIINGCATASCMSSSMTFTGAENINVSAPNAIHVANNGVVATVDPTGSSVLGVSLSTMTSAVHDVVSQRMARTRTSGIPAAGRGLSSWGQTIGAYRSRGTEGSAMGHSHSYVGFTGGMEKKVKEGRVGVIAGYASSSVSTKKMSNSTNTNSFFGGIYGDIHLGRQVSLTTSLLGGYEYHDNTRNVRNNVVGVEAAKSDFSSVFFSPSVTLSSAHPFEVAGRSFQLRPSTTAVYTISQYDNYQEKGTTGSNLAVGNRTVQALKIRTQLAVAMALNKHSEFELRSGFVTRHTDHDDIKASLGSTSFRFAGAGNNSVQGGFVGGSFRLHATDNLRASVDVKFRGAGGRESEFIGRAGIGYSF